MKRMKKTAAVTAAVLSASMLLGAMPAVAAPATAQSGSASGSLPPVAVAPQAGMGGFTSANWLEIARSAERAGDKVSAQAARQAASAVKSGSHTGGGTVQLANIFTAVAKKALVAALRFGGQKLPQSMRPYANKIANVIEDVGEFQEGALISAFQAVGIPYDVASTAATWCVVFLGV